MQQFSPAGGQKLQHLVTLDGTLQDDAPGSEVAGSFRADRFLANVCHRLFEHSGSAFGAGAKRLLSREVRSFCVAAPAILTLPEVKLGFHIARKPEYPGKWFAHAAAEAG